MVRLSLSTPFGSKVNQTRCILLKFDTSHQRNVEASNDESRRLVDPFKVDTIPEDGPGHPKGGWLSGGLRGVLPPFFLQQRSDIPQKGVFFLCWEYGFPNFHVFG